MGTDTPDITTDFIDANANDPATLRLEVAILMYSHEAWSLRKAAQFAGIFWDDFSGILKARNIIAGTLTTDEFEQEVTGLKKAGLL